MKRQRKWPALSERYKRMADASMTPEQLARWTAFVDRNSVWVPYSEPIFRAIDHAPTYDTMVDASMRAMVRRGRSTTAPAVYGIDFVNSGQPYPRHDDDNAARDMLRLMKGCS